MNNFFVRDTGLMPEQEQVLVKATARQPSSEIICVQGVAGSGKTTIALSTALQLGKRNKERARDQKQSILFLTYNRSLADACHQALQNKPDLDGIMAPRGELQPRMVNVLTIQELFKLAMPEIADRTLDDIDCIGKISEIAGERGITGLLPSQIFALITTFLRGRKELIWKMDQNGQLTKNPVRVADLEAIINLHQRRTGHYRIYRESLIRIAKYLLSTYEDWKEENLDRSDIARSFYERIAFLEQDLIRLMAMKAEEYRRLSEKKLGDRDFHLRRISEWMRAALLQYQETGAIEQEAKKYFEKFNGSQINGKELSDIQNALMAWIPQYGLRVEPLWSNIIAKLPNPVMVVDEVQDLSSIECENLISLWFQLQRTHESRMILLGDLNQQMTPSGFEWDQLVTLIEKKQALYRVNNQKPELPTPLDNNYRTTKYIAETIASMLRQVATCSLSPEEARRLLEHSIDPEKTMLGDDRLFQMEEDIRKREGEESLVPRLLIGPGEVFEKGLEIYLNRLISQRDQQSDDQVLSTVVITEHADALDEMLDNFRQNAAIPTSMVEVIPVLACKGLEFDRCVLYGISRAEAGDLTTDLLSKWYTSFTRARIQLLIFLTSEEFDYIYKAGWQKTDGAVFLERVTNPEKVASELEHIGMTELDDNLLVEFGERRFTQFLAASKTDPKKEEYLSQSLADFDKANRPDYFQRRAKQAAEWYEGQKLWEQAAHYFYLADEVVKEVNCLHMASLESWQIGDQKNAGALKMKAIERITALPSQRVLEKAVALVAMGEIEKGFIETQSADGDIKQQIADEVMQQAGRMPDPKQIVLHATLLSKYGFPDQAASVYLLAGDLRQALASAAKPGSRTLDRIAQAVFKFANDWVAAGRTDDVAQLAGQLDACGQFHFAGELFTKVNDSLQAMYSYIRSKEYALAENRAELLNTPQAFLSLGKAYEQAGRDHWTSAYEMFHRSGDQTEVQRMEKRLRNEQLFIPLAEAYKKVGQPKLAESLATENHLRSEFDVSARCWEIAEQWSYACGDWYQAYYYYHENFERLLGVDSEDRKVNPAILNRFFKHLEQNQQRYEYDPENQAEDPSSYHAATAESVRTAYRAVQKISSKSNWRIDLESLIEELRKAFRRSNLIQGGGERLPHMPPAGALDEERTKLYWNSINDVLDLFRKRAQSIAWDQFRTPGKELEGVRMMVSVCKFPKGAEEMVNSLRKRGSIEERKLWIQSWLLMGWTDDQVDRELRNLHPKQESELFFFASDILYQNNQKRREELRLNFRKRLEGFKDKDSRKLLEKYFPGYQPPATAPAGKGKRKAKDDSSVSVVDLVGEFKGRVREFITDEDNGDAFDMFVDKMLSEPDKVDKLESRWRRAKEYLPDQLNDELIQLIDQIQEAIDSQAANLPVPTPDSTPETSYGEPAASESDDENELENEEDESDDQEQAKDEIENSDKGSKSVRSSSRRRRSRRANRKVIEPFTTDQIKVRDLHEYSLDDAMNELEGDIKECLNDAVIRCLVVIHGIGNHATNKNKQAGVIRDSVRSRLQDLVREQPQKVFRVFDGENLDQVNQDMTVVMTACQDFPSDLRGRRNQGISVVVFN